MNAARGETRFEAGGAVTVAARPWLRTVEVAAARTCVRGLHFVQVEELFPVLALFGERRRTVAHLDPLHAAVVELTRIGHVAEVFVARDRALAERAVVDRLSQRFVVSRLYARGDEVSHDVIVPLVALHLLRRA